MDQKQQKFVFTVSTEYLARQCGVCVCVCVCQEHVVVWFVNSTGDSHLGTTAADSGERDVDDVIVDSIRQFHSSDPRTGDPWHQ